MTDPENSSAQNEQPSFRLDRFLRSDLLPNLLALLRSLPAIAPFVAEVIQLHVVIDANIVQGELRWRLGRRRNPSARSDLHEAIDSGVMVAIAPPYLAAEIVEHEGRIAAETKSSIEDVRREWKAFRRLLHFYTPISHPTCKVNSLDIDDLPYLATSKELGLAVYSRDHDLSRMGAPVIRITLDRNLRSYARATSISIGVEVGSSFGIVLSLHTIATAYGIVKRGVRGFQKLHPVAQVAIIVAAVLAIAHPKSRAKLASAWKSIAGLAKASLFPPLADAMLQYAEAKQIVDSNYDRIRNALPFETKRTLLMYARAACSIAKTPVRLEDLGRRVRAAGYRSNSSTFQAYLRRVLVKSGEFVEARPGLWTLRTTATAGAG